MTKKAALVYLIYVAHNFNVLLFVLKIIVVINHTGTIKIFVIRS